LLLQRNAASRVFACQLDMRVVSLWDPGVLEVVGGVDNAITEPGGAIEGAMGIMKKPKNQKAKGSSCCCNTDVDIGRDWKSQ